MRPVNAIIRAARERLGLSLDDVAQRSGLSWNEYYDLELHESEAIEVVNVRNLKRVCAELGLDLLDNVGIECAFCGRPGLQPSGAPIRRDQLVRTQRERFGLARDQLGDLIGFETIAIEEMEKDQGFLDRWPIDLVVELAGYLEVPPQLLLGVACRKCGG